MQYYSQRPILKISDNIYSVWKYVSETPGQIIQECKQYQIFNDIKEFCYSGRLDPMADGWLLILTGSQVKNMTYYNNKSKVYQFDIVPGLKTDSLDVMGNIVSQSDNLKDIFNSLSFQQTIDSFNGITYNQKYPLMSSFNLKYNGKRYPLWQLAKILSPEEISKINIPSKNVTIYSLEIVSVTKISLIDFFWNIITRIRKVEGDFNQSALIRNWCIFFAKEFSKDRNKEFYVYRLEASVSSGTYIRQLVNDIEQKYNLENEKENKLNLLTYNIRRTELVL